MSADSNQPTQEFSTDEIQITEFSAGDREEATDLLARGLRDNPTMIAVFGQDPDQRVRQLQKQFDKTFSVSENDGLIARDTAGNLIGILVMAPPGACPSEMSVGQRLRMMPVVLQMGLGTTRRVIEWMGTLESKDPEAPHWHLGPAAVEPALQGHGIGTRLFEACCERMDALDQRAYLETDKQVNVELYERFGFEIVDEIDVLDTRNWFMSRSPR